MSPSVRLAAIVVAALLLAATGCGDDDENTQDTAGTPATVPTETSGTVTETETAEEPEETETAIETETETEAESPTSPEDEPGGAGDEIPARSLALFTGRGGRISPSVVRVPAFISVRVELRSADGADYGIRIGGRTLRVGGDIGSVSKVFDGLRPNEVLAGTLEGAPGRVRVEATAEPGP
jgi:hypothetical protein